MSGADEMGGLLYDLGSHLVDQVLHLLGPARTVYAEVRAVRRVVASDDDVSAYVQQLEERGDEDDELEEADLPSGDALAAELERFLREQGDA